MLSCAILDDYQDCALTFADWKSLQGIMVKTFTEFIPTIEALVAQLAAFDIIVIMRERTKIDAALLERLPRLKLLITTGMKNDAIDIKAAVDRGLIGAKELEKMKPTAMFINDARGPLVDEQALIQVLKENRIAGAALDVYDNEPLPTDHPFRTLPNVIATPHLGYVTRENYKLFYEEAVEDIQGWLVGMPVRVLSPPE